MDPRMKMYIFPIENGDFPASYVSLPEGICQIMSCAKVFLFCLTYWKFRIHATVRKGYSQRSAVSLELVRGTRSMKPLVGKSCDTYNTCRTYGMDNMWMLVVLYIMKILTYMKFTFANLSTLYALPVGLSSEIYVSGSVDGTIPEGA